jgi:tRNA nucleotidyltransferase/poly(A) polymerase
VNKFSDLYESYSKKTFDKILSSVKKFNKDSKVYFVGGAVRDEIMGFDPKDIDFLVTKISLSDLASVLEPLGKINEVGKSFGIVKAVIDGEEFDFAIPRTETSTGSGHRDQITNTDPTLSVEDDLARRDFTFNAIAKDVETGEYIDPFNGQQDISDKIINAVGNPDIRFTEDPLRMLRAVQFAVRFGFKFNPKTAASIKKNIGLLNNLSEERFREEFSKAITKSITGNSKDFLKLLKDTGIGEFLFSGAFNPIPVKSKDINVNLVAMFINGGNYKKLKLSNSENEMIELARKTLFEAPEPWKWCKKVDLMEPVLEFLKLSEKKEWIYVNKIMSFPLTLKSLAVTGDELMEAGIPNVQIGKVTNSIIEAIWNGRLKNDKDSILSFVSK